MRPRRHFGAQRLAGGLHAVADSQDGNTQFKNPGIGSGRALLINAGGAPRENQPAGSQFPDPLDGQIMPHELRKDILFADPAGDQLGCLRTEIEHQDPLGRRGDRGGIHRRGRLGLRRGGRGWGHGKMGTGGLEKPGSNGGFTPRCAGRGAGAFGGTAGGNKMNKACSTANWPLRSARLQIAQVSRGDQLHCGKVPKRGLEPPWGKPPPGPQPGASAISPLGLWHFPTVTG